MAGQPKPQRGNDNTCKSQLPAVVAPAQRKRPSFRIHKGWHARRLHYITKRETADGITACVHPGINDTIEKDTPIMDIELAVGNGERSGTKLTSSRSSLARVDNGGGR